MPLLGPPDFAKLRAKEGVFPQFAARAGQIESRE
jgi:hypothetical protein